MKNKQEIKNELVKLLPQMKKLAKMMNEAEDNWTNQHDPEDLYLRDMFYKIAEKLDSVRYLGEQLDKPIVAEGNLYRNSAGRYAVNNDYYFTSGSPIEFLLKDEEYGDRWVYSSVEHDEDYYIVNNKRLKMDGLKVRVKYSPSWG